MKTGFFLHKEFEISNNMSIADNYFSEILTPYTKPKTLNALTNEGDLCTYKVQLNKKFDNTEEDQSTPYLLISKQCFDHANTFVFIQNFYQQYHFSHPAIMPLVQLSISPNNSFEAYYKYPENGKLSDYIGFAHENVLSDSKVLTPTQKSIISYGLAHALRYIHQHDYQFGEVNAKNVYLDSEFHPYLTNFYSIKKINDQRVPKKQRLTDLHLKLDVLTYSIIYAALIEPVAFDPPVESVQEFFHRFVQEKKRPVCKNATEEQRDVLDKMWDWIPRDRLSFDEIINCFDSGNLIFEGTDENEFDKYRNYLNEYQDTMQTPPSSPYSPSSSHNKPSPESVRQASEKVLDKNENDANIIEEEEEIDDAEPISNHNDDNDFPRGNYRTRTINLTDDNDDDKLGDEFDSNRHDDDKNENDEDADNQEDENNDDGKNELNRDDDDLNENNDDQNDGINVQSELNENNEDIVDQNDGINVQSDLKENNDDNVDQSSQLNDNELKENNEDNVNQENNQSEIKEKDLKQNETKKQDNDENIEKKLNIMVSRYDDKNFKECADDASSHSYQDDEEDDALSQTQSVDSDIQFINVSGEVQQESE